MSLSRIKRQLNLSEEASIGDIVKAICILQAKCNSSLANNLCPDCRDKQGGKSCLACWKGQAIEILKDVLKMQSNSDRVSMFFGTYNLNSRIDRLMENS